jgi:hypothetical protein
MQYTEQQLENRRAAHRRWMERNPGKRKQYYKEYDETRYDLRTPQRMVNSARTRAKQASLPFNLKVADIIIPKDCPICYNEMISAKGIRGGSKNSPTLDRIICSKGYVKGNVAVICKNCNSKKGHASSEELRHIADWIDSYKT